MSDSKIPVEGLVEEDREELAGIVAQFIRLSSKTDIVTSTDAFNVAFSITSIYESSSMFNFTPRKETVELAIELVKRARNRISLEDKQATMEHAQSHVRQLGQR